jgi:hypothetical protein
MKASFSADVKRADWRWLVRSCFGEGQVLGFVLGEPEIAEATPALKR